MHQEFMACKLSEAKECRLADDPDADDDDEEEEEEEEEELERMHQWVIEQRKELAAWSQEAETRILGYDPKQGGLYHSRIYSVYDLAPFDHDDESSHHRVQITHGIDSTMLILTGPKRGLALISSAYVETNLIIKGDQRHGDRELSKGILEISGIERQVLKKYELALLLTGLVLWIITKSLVLHDSRLAHITSGKKLPPIKLLLSIANASQIEDGEITMYMDPKVNGSSQYEITVVTTILHVKIYGFVKYGLSMGPHMCSVIKAE
ncbi:hypothetical protein U9M48_041501 [Paspalum notatum var. saurae]|uniref:DUF6598 domain-containing protein n=1 Tax=Paspalum notatum var. saurae TaxID=547442 RepID=A0AAQ3UNH3_PASNO